MQNMSQHERDCRELGKIFAAIPDSRAMTIFLKGMLTPSELEEIMRRWRLIMKLRKGQTQREIAQQLGISLGKISRGSRLLKYGEPGFSRLLREISEKLTAENEPKPKQCKSRHGPQT